MRNKISFLRVSSRAMSVWLKNCSFSYKKAFPTTKNKSQEWRLPPTTSSPSKAKNIKPLSLCWTSSSKWQKIRQKEPRKTWNKKTKLWNLNLIPCAFDTGMRSKISEKKPNFFNYIKRKTMRWATGSGIYRRTWSRQTKLPTNMRNSLRRKKEKVKA